MATPGKQPAWFTAAIDQRLALLEQHIGNRKTGADLIMTMLIEPPETASDLERELWERRCDGCGKDCNNESFFTGQFTGNLRNGSPFLMVYGICATCRLDFE